jgi:hypothetical protein
MVLNRPVQHKNLDIARRQMHTPCYTFMGQNCTLIDKFYTTIGLSLFISTTTSNFPVGNKYYHFVVLLVLKKHFFFVAITVKPIPNCPMYLLNRSTTFILLMLLVSSALYAQEQPATLVDKVADFPTQLFSRVNSRITGIEDKLVRQTQKSLQRLAKQEERLKRKLSRKDTAAANALFGRSAEIYSRLQRAIQSSDSLVSTKKAGDYIPEFDSVKTMLGFLEQNPQALAGKGTQQLKEAASAATSVSNKLKQVAEIKKLLKNRKNFLSGQLDKYGLSAQMKKINKEFYYYNQYIQQYKALLNDPSRIEQTALSVLNKIPAFKEFAQKNSFLAALFPSSNDLAFNAAGALPPIIPGLQTRAQTGQLVSENMLTAATGGGTQDIFSQPLGNIRQELSKLKSKSSSWDENAEMPNFKPNEMKTRSFWGKLEPGFNFQFGKSVSQLPSTADIGAQVAYKFHQNGSFGIGTAYKLGFGDIRRVAFSHQGISARSFFDYKLKGSFFANAGFEYNYNAAFKDLEQLKDYSAWQSSALAGLSKKYKLSKKFKGNLVLLYDFLHKQHSPNTQAFVFRFGYNF